MISIERPAESTLVRASHCRPSRQARLLQALLTLLLMAGQASHAQPPFAGEFFITRNEDPVCVPFVRNLNQFRRLDFDACQLRLSSKFPQFESAPWREVPLDLAIAEKAFKSTSMFKGERGQQATEPRWQAWLQGTAQLRGQGQVKMWLAEVDVFGDGRSRTIARVQYGMQASDRAVRDRACAHTHSAMWMLDAPGDRAPEAFNNNVYGANDIVIDAGSKLSYVLGWQEGDAGPEFEGRNIGATRGVLVLKASEFGLAPVCHINWVPTGKFRPLKRK